MSLGSIHKPELLKEIAVLNSVNEYKIKKKNIVAKSFYLFNLC